MRGFLHKGLAKRKGKIISGLRSCKNGFAKFLGLVYKKITKNLLLWFAILYLLVAVWILSDLHAFAYYWLGFDLIYDGVSPRDLLAGMFAPALALLGFYFANHRN